MLSPDSRRSRMASPCTNDPNEVINAVVGIQAAEENFERELDDVVSTAAENASKFDTFVNGSDTQTVQLGEGAATPTIRNTVRQMMSAAAELPNADVSGKSSTANGGSIMRSLAERFGDISSIKDFGASGDGLTDDTSAFAAAAATGKAAFLPAGTYSVSDDVEGKFFCFDGATSAGSTKVEDFYKTARLQKMMSVACSLVGPVQTYCSSYYPEHPYYTFWYQSACYDSKRDVFYLAQENMSDESQAGKIQTLTDILDPSTVTASTASIAGHFNDIEYDAKNDVLYVATGQTGAVEKSIYILNPETKAATDTWYVGFNVWSLAVKDGWLYTVNGSGNLVRYDTTTKTQDDSFSIPAGDPPMVDNEVFAAQAMFFINDILVRSGVVVNSGAEIEQKRCAFILYDIETGVSFSCGYKSGNYKELEGCAVKNGTIYLMFSSPWYLTFGVSKVGLFSASGPYSKLITSSNEYSDLDKCIDDGVYHIKDAATLSALTNAPNIVHPEEATLTVRKLGAGGWCEQTLTLATGEEFTRIGGLAAGRFFRTWYKKGFSGQYGPATGTVSLNNFTEPGLISLTGVSDAPGGAGGNLLVYRWDNYSITYAGYLQMWFRAGTNEIYIRGGSNTGGGVSWNDWSKLFCSNRFFNSNVSPSASNTYSLGQDGYRWSNIYAYTSTIGTSDERLKGNIANPSEALMRAWGKVNFKVFQFKDAIEKKGNEARIHVGIIAQQIQQAFASEGLDANKYGLFCYDRWDEEWNEETVVDEQEKLDEYGNVVSPMKTHVERTLKREAGDLYSLRYEECLALECAYQRWRLEQLESRLSEISGNSPAPSGASPDNL